MPVPALERLHDDLRVERRHALHVDDARLQKDIALHAWKTSGGRRRLQAACAAQPSPLGLLAIEFDDEALVDVLAEFGPLGRTLERAGHLLRVDLDPCGEADLFR